MKVISVEIYKNFPETHLIFNIFNISNIGWQASIYLSTQW